MPELFDAIDALVASRSPLPPPAERKRLRQAHGLTLEEVATTLDVRRATVGAWESGKTEPRPPQREPYAHLLKQLARLYPSPTATEGGTPPATPAATAPPVPSAVVEVAPPAPVAAVAAPVPAPAATPPSPTAAPRPARGSRRPGAPRATTAGSPAPAGSGTYGHGPLLVLDTDDERQVTGYGTGGLLLDVPARSLPSLVEWALSEARVGAEKLHASGKDADPLLVLTAAACERYGLPAALSDEERSAGRLPEGHKVIKLLERAGWKLTRRGLGPWARVYRPVTGGRRQCVQLCIPSWNALDDRSWGHAATLEPAELARVLGVYAQRVMTPVGSTAVSGLELMTALSPPTRASEPDQDGKRHSEHRPGSLGKEPVDPAPCEAIDGHPVLAHLPRFHIRGPRERLFEEAYDWARDLTDAECMQPHLVGIDVNLAFGAAANGAVVGLDAPPEHVTGPVFDPAVPGSWLVDLSHVDLSRVKVAKQWRDLQGGLLPSPFTPAGERPEGPAWYATPTVAYAVELGYDVTPLEAWLRPRSGRFLDGWYKRLRDAYVATMADLGVAEKLPPGEFLKAMDGYKGRDPELGIVVDAVKMTVKGGIGKLQEKARGGGWVPGQAWPALARPTWRPDIRAAVISRARVNMHRKMVALAAATGRYPVAVLSDCAVYTADGPSPLDVLPYDTDGKTVPGSFRLGVSPGMVKHEGTQDVLWGVGVLEQLAAEGKVANLARYIKSGEVTARDTGE
ncbi:helix-turn-helix transcriptional regulator [Streptomyces sp. 196(2019)]|uniref:telomere-associated protein Tap n=1 Tax=Streptomyces sp. 196(2019) TaxID=2683820 RepID=UPI0013EC4CAD|nr:helix-turn-helix transcriptional regulator [Streptomyces sp. 196(2019)]NGO86884.1 helix-turn-helix domain-containing protein [Streptomyces sp. 196(2019)]